MPEDHLPRRHRHCWGRWEPRGVGRLLKDVSAFKELPKRVRRIGQSTMCECIGLEKVTKLIINGWLRDWPDGKKRRPDHQNQHAQPDPTQRLVARQFRKPAFKLSPQIT